MRQDCFIISVKGGFKLVILLAFVICLICQFSYYAVGQQPAKPITKDNLISALRLGREQGKASATFVELIKRHGVDFQMTPEDEKSIRQAGSYLGVKGLHEFVEAVQNNFRPVEIGTPAELKPPDSNSQDDNLVVMITCKMEENEFAFGGGIIVGAQSNRVYIVTVNHLVRRADKEASDIRVRFKWLPGESIEAKLLTDVEQRLDLAVLSVSGSRSVMDRVNTLPFNKLTASKTVTRGDNVYTIGHPHGRQWETSIEPDKVVKSKVGLIEFRSNFIYPGHGGGALVNEQGEIVGMITADAPPNTEAIKIDAVLETLKSWGYPVGTHN